MKNSRLAGLTAGDLDACIASHRTALTARHRTAPHRQAIDALALCDVDGRIFLEMDEEDLAESDELGLDVSTL